MAQTVHAARSFDAPLREMNTTPLIDVMLVLLVIFILAVPAAVNQIRVDLPSMDLPDRPLIDHLRNRISITPTSQITWNARPISQAQLAALLQASRQISPEPELQFEPDPAAPYDTAAKVLNTVKQSGITAFGFVGNDSYATFGKVRRTR